MPASHRHQKSTALGMFTVRFISACRDWVWGRNVFDALPHVQSCGQRLTLLMMMLNRLSVIRVIRLRIWMDQA